MKFLARLEKQKIAWILILLCVIFSFLRLPSLIEPYWYGDEGIYEVIGQSLNHGELLYRDIWDNKPPILYVIYALANGDQPTVKIISLIIGLMTIIAFYFLSQKLFAKQKISILLTSLLILFFATPLLEANIANAENFILLPIILAGLLIYQYATHYKSSTLYPKSLLIAGFLLGIAFLLKIVAVFDLAAFLLFYILINLPKNISWSLRKNTIDLNTKMQELWNLPLTRTALFLILGFLLPFFITILYFGFNNGLKDFIQSAFFGNVDYVGWKNTIFGIPQGGLIIKTVLLAVGIWLIFKYRKRFDAPTIFILIWIIFALYNVYFSGRPYTHYAIVLLPSFCLFIGLIFKTNSLVNKMKIFAVVVIVAFALNYQFNFSFTHSIHYYQNVMQFLNGHKSVEDYQTFFDSKVPRDYTVANFITTHTSASDSVFVWGNNPEIYALAHKTPIGKYTVAYHVAQNNSYDETQSVINKREPKYIIVLSESQPLPFVIPLYIMRYNISGATIYERSL